MDNEKDNGIIGCRGGRDKTKIIDPNDFNGFNSSSNMSVPLEDLNISVRLTTQKKARTVLTTEKEGSTATSSKKVDISFISGSTINGKTILTTKYTDLTTVFEKGTQNNETLGITNIDIDFNSSYAPQITINFIDVRGSSIFQNESEIAGENTTNPYATLFQIPYPLFELEIKGYYGKPVTYCLHMIKFNSKFNSQTGNFEMQCEFVGYTYAMLSDLLIGYLKVISRTDIGKIKYAAYNANKDKNKAMDVLTLLDLVIKLQTLNEGLTKEASDSPYAVGSRNCGEAITQLSAIKDTINNLGKSLSVNLLKDGIELDKFNYIAIGSKEIMNSNDITNYKNGITTIIDKFNKLNLGITLNVAEFTNLTIYSSVTLPMFNTNNESGDAVLTTKVGTQENLKKFKGDIYSFLTSNTILEDTTKDTQEINLYNMDAMFNKLTEVTTSVQNKDQDYRKDLATELANKVTQSLTFSPTVRNIVEIYTAACEVFLETIYEVSTSAEIDNGGKRRAQLAPKFTFMENADLPNVAKGSKFYAWPAYRQKDESKGVYVEKYLGDPSVGLPNPEDVHEIKFINNLFMAFINAAKEEANAERNLNNETKLWLPINPIDTKLFVSEEPYGRAEIKTDAALARLATIRGMTFLGYTNDGLTLSTPEIIAMAEAEADNILRSVDTRIIQLLIPRITEAKTDSAGTAPTKAYSKSLDVYINSSGVINSATTKVVVTDDGRTGYFYNYIHELKLPNFIKTVKKNNNFDLTKTEVYENLTLPRDYIHESVIPINERFEGYWPITRYELQDLHDNGGLIFLTNYSAVSTFPDPKWDDGGIYIKIFNISQFNEITNNILLNELPEKASTESILNQKQLELSRDEIFNKPTSVGFNVLGGPLGIQEFSVVNDGTKDGAKGKVMNLFYSNDIEKMQTGLGGSRVKTLSFDIESKPTDFDNKKLTGRKFGYQKQYYRTSKSDSSKNLHNSYSLNRTLLNNETNISNSYIDITYPYIEQPIMDTHKERIVGKIREQYDSNAFSLFGSKLYYAQSKSRYPDYAKAFLFLNNLPFNKGLKTGSPFENNEIINLFNMRGGFIHAPLLWCAWVGSILWRKDYSEPIPENGRIIGGGAGYGSDNDPIKWYFNGVSEYDNPFYTHPNRNQYLTCVNVNLRGHQADFIDIDEKDILINIPMQARDEFKTIFFDFVKVGGGISLWETLRDSLEIWKGTSADFNKYVDDFNHLVKASVDNGTYNYSAPTTTFLKNEDKYAIISPIVPYGTATFNDYLFLELSANGNDNPLIPAMTNEVVICNNGYHIWTNPYDGKVPITGEKHHVIYARNEIFNIYFKALNNRLVASKVGMGETEQRKEIINSIFGTTNESVIKLNLYKHCKNIYDKWLGGTTDPAKIMYQCGVSRNSTDSGLALKYGNNKSKFIDSFRFVNRSFRDIGDLLYINPIPINDYLTENQNSSVYDSVSSILASNNFDFIALPTFINFHDDDELKAIFRPYGNYGKAIKEGSCGPTFVCVYTGEKSKHLAIVGSEYPNDGFDLRCTKSQTTATSNDNTNNSNNPKEGTLLGSVPNDFGSIPKDGKEPVTEEETKNNNKFEDPVGVFTVKYSQQNQNIFKDISLDQSEFTETEESIKIMDDISQKGAETNRTLAGQNLYGVYSVRSYKAEVEMMGNAMIQPMMYFQLDNIPMFHGAYMIIRVKHSIKPNYMSTNFTGVRIKYSETPLITASDVYMSLIDTLDLSSAVDTSAGNFTGNGLSQGDYENIKTIKCNAVTKTVIEFSDVLKAVVAYLEGNYCSGGTDCGDKPNKITSGETLWGLDRKRHESTTEEKAFWKKADELKKKTTKRWGQSYPTPYTEETKDLFALYVPIFQKMYNSFSKSYYTNQTVKGLVESDGRLYFNLVYAVYNGQLFFKGIVKLMESEYNKGKKTADALLQSVVNDRVGGLQHSYFLAYNKQLGNDGSYKIAKTGIKIEKLVGLASTCQ